MKTILFILLMLCLQVFVHGQNAYVIQYPNPAEGLTSCMGSSELEVRIDVAAFDVENTQVTVHLPAGVTYVPGSVVTIEASAGLSISENGGTASSPIFSISPASLTAGDYLIFTISRRANCRAVSHAILGGVFKDEVVITGSKGTVAENLPTLNNYNVDYASLSITSPNAITEAVVRGNYTRTFTITNGAAVCSDNIHFYIVYPSGGITLNSLTLNGVNLTASRTNGDTLFYDLSGADVLTADGILCSGENLSLTENFSITGCVSEATKYAAGTGCGSKPKEWCQTGTGTGSIALVSGLPRLTTSGTGYLNFVNMCTPTEYSFTLTNSGIGNAVAAAMYNLEIKHGMHVYTSNYDGIDNSGNRMFTLSNIRINDNIPVEIVYTGPINNQGMHIYTSQFNSDPDGSEGLADLDGDGQFDDLPLGKSVKVTITLTYRNIAKCNLSGPGYIHPPVGIHLNAAYSTMCNPTISSPPALGGFAPGSFYYYGASTFNPTFLSSPNVLAEIPFKISLSALPVNFNWPRSINRAWRWRLILPSSVSVAPIANSTYNGVATNYTSETPDTISITGKSTNPSAIEINLVHHGGANGSFTIPYLLEYIDDLNAPCTMNKKMVCNSFTLNAQGYNENCTNGPISSIPVIRRSDYSLGYTNGSLSTRVNSSSISAKSLAHAIFGDTIIVSGGMRQMSDATNLYAHLGLDKTSQRLDKILPIRANIKVFKNKILTNTCTLWSWSTAYGNSTHSDFEWDITSCLPSGIIETGDSVFMEARYVVATNDGLPTTSYILASGGEYSFYNRNTDGQTMNCNSFIPELYLLQISASLAVDSNPNSNLFKGCTLLEKSGYESSYNGTEAFPNEFRPNHFIDSLAINVPAGIIVQGLKFTSATIYPPTRINGNRYVFINNGTWPVYKITANSSTRLFSIQLIPGCSTSVSQSLSTIFYSRRFFHLESIPLPALPINPALFPSVINSTINLTYNSKPAIVLSNQTGTIRATQTTESWVFRITNPSLYAAPNLWFAIVNNPNITITQVIDKSTSNPISLLPYSGGSWYKVSDVGLAAGATKDYEVFFTLTGCTSQSLTVNAGWNCSGYPTDPSVYACQAVSLDLGVEVPAAEVQLIQVAVPSFINACESTVYQYAVKSAQAGNILDNLLTLTLPSGLSLENNSFRAEYPRGSNNFQIISPTIIGSSYTFDLTTHPAYPVSGLPGTLVQSTEVQRQIGVSFTLTAGCDFVSGRNFSINTSANRVCGQPATGSSVTIQGPVMQIIGIQFPYQTVNRLSLTNESLGNCLNKVTLNVENVIIASNSTSGGKAFIDLPAGFEYVEESFLCVEEICPNLISVNLNQDGSQQLEFSIPAGLIAGSKLIYSVEIQDINAGCLQHSLNLNTISYALGTSCSGSNCPNAQLATGSGSITIQAQRPNLQITALSETLLSRDKPIYILNLSASNTGPVSSQPVVISFYCANAQGLPDGPVRYSYTTSGQVNPGSSFNVKQIISTNDCNSQFGIVAVISDADNCSCDGASILYDQPESIEFTDVNWTGSISNDWQIPQNWDIMPLPIDNVFIASQTNQPVITNSNSDPAICNNLSIASGANLTIAPGKALTVNGAIANNAGTTGLIIQSDAQGNAGTLIHASSGVQATMTRKMGDANSWAMISSPVDAQLATGEFTQNGHLFAWSEAAQSWVKAGTSVAWPTWVQTNNGHNNFIPAQGYLVSYDLNALNKSFTGNLNQGIINLSLSFHAKFKDSYQGFNMAGNPYPSVIDWKATSGWNRSDLVQEVGGGYTYWVWNNTAGNYGAFISSGADESGTNGATRYIAPNQAFWVRARQTGNLQMNNLIRTHAPSIFLKSVRTEDFLVRIGVWGEDTKYRDEVLISMNNNSESGGAAKMFSFISGAPSIYSVKDGQNYSIGLINKEATQPIVVAFKAAKDGFYTIDATTGFGIPELILEDRITGMRIDLKKQKSYRFQALVDDNPHRFLLHLGKATKAGLFPSVETLSWYASGMLTITNLLGENSQAELFDMAGRLIRSWQLPGKGQFTFSITPEQRGVYLLKISNSKMLKTEKLFMGK